MGPPFDRLAETLRLQKSNKKGRIAALACGYPAYVPQGLFDPEGRVGFLKNCNRNFRQADEGRPSVPISIIKVFTIGS
jgi:hypothetical protein